MTFNDKLAWNENIDGKGGTISSLNKMLVRYVDMRTALITIPLNQPTYIHNATTCNAFIACSKDWGIPKPNALVEIFTNSMKNVIL